MSGKASKFDAFITPTSFDRSAANDSIKSDIKMVLDAMLGEGYEVDDQSVSYLLSIHTKKGKDPLSVVCANHRVMREHILNIAHHAITGTTYTVIGNKKKNKQK